VSERILINEIKLTRGLDPDENLKELARDLKANGQKVPILVLPDLSLVDGLRRVMALHAAGVTEVDAIVASTFEEAIEALHLAHSGLPPDRVRRSWEIARDLNPLIQERKIRFIRERQKGVRRTERQPSTQPLARTLLEYAIGKGYDKIVQTYQLAFAHKPTGWRETIRALEARELTVGGAYDKIRGKTPLRGNIRTVKEQKQIVDGAARQLTALLMSLEKLAWPIVIPIKDRQLAIEELRKNRGKLARIIHLLEEAEPND